MLEHIINIQSQLFNDVKIILDISNGDSEMYCGITVLELHILHI
jgi:hypothetical protein